MLSDNDLELLSAYLDGALSEGERVRLEARLQAEPELRRKLARLHATVALVRALPTLTAPRDLTLTRRMVHRTSFLTSAAFSALSAAAAVVLLIIVATLFSTSQRQAVTNFAPNQVAALPTTTIASTLTKTELDEESQQSAASNSASTDLGLATQQAQSDQFRAAPTETEPSSPQPPATDGILADAAVAQESATEQPLEQAAPSAASGAAAAQAPLPIAPTLAPTIEPSRTPTPAPTASFTPTPLPSPTLVPTLAPTSTPVPQAAFAPESSTISLALVVLALALLALAVVSTVVRRRS